MNAPLKLDTALERTLKLAEQGFYLFPSWRKDRHIAAWPARATRNADTLRAWFTGPYRDCWPSIFTGKFGDGSQSLIVVDVDPRGLAAVDALDSLLPDTRVHRTPRKGLHGFYVAPFPGVKSGTNILADGIDIRGKGGLVHFGEGYTIEQDEPIAQAPASLIAKCGELAPATAPADRAQDRISPDQETALQRAEEIMRAWPKVAEGERNTALRDFIYRVRETCATDAESTLMIGLSFAAEVCNPPYPEDQARATIRSAIKSAQNPAGSKTALPEDFPAVASAEPAPVAKARTKGGTLQDMARRINSGAYLVKGMLRRKSHAVMFGQPGEGKSFLALDLAYHVAAGREWHGLRVSQGPVLYLAFEGLGGIPERAAALLQHYGNATVPFVIEPADWNLRDKAGREALGARMTEIRAEHFGGQHPALIVIDTLARSMRGGDENSAQDMGALNDAVGALIEHTGAAVLLIHHSGKNQAAGARGSSALLGAVDTEIKVDDGQVKATKQRDVELSASVGFKLVPVVVGEDADGDDMLSCVVVAGAGRTQATWKPSGKAAIAWTVLCALGGDSNAPVSLGDLSREFRAKAYPTRKTAESTSRSALDRALGAFLGRKMIEGPAGGPWRRAFLDG
jgi:hypothetical protein